MWKEMQGGAHGGWAAARKQRQAGGCSAERWSTGS